VPEFGKKRKIITHAGAVVPGYRVTEDFGKCRAAASSVPLRTPATTSPEIPEAEHRSPVWPAAMQARILVATRGSRRCWRGSASCERSSRRSSRLIHAQVRVITGDIEHIYGPGGEVWDDNALRARNERAERERKIENIRRQAKRRQDETDAEYRRSQAEYDQAVSALNERIERSQSKKVRIEGFSAIKLKAKK
jgi:hypothetical protein